MKKTTYEKAVCLLSESNTLTLSVMDEDTYPKAYAMEKVLSQELDRIIFITKKNSNKVRLLNINNKCCIEVHTEDDAVCLKGSIQIHESEEEKRKTLPLEYIKRLEHSGSQKYCVLIFNTFKGDLYIDGENYLFVNSGRETK